MPQTRIYQCPNCGELHPTRRDKGYIKCSCGHKGEIRRHIVKTAQLTKDQQAEIAGGKAEKAPPTEKTQGASMHVASSQPGQKGSGRFQIVSQPKGDTMTKEKDQDQDNYGCKKCELPVKKGQKHCPNCGAELDWSGID